MKENQLFENQPVMRANCQPLDVLSHLKSEKHAQTLTGSEPQIQELSINELQQIVQQKLISRKRDVTKTNSRIRIGISAVHIREREYPITVFHNVQKRNVARRLDETEDSVNDKRAFLKDTMTSLMDTSDSEEDDIPLLGDQNPAHFLIRKTITEYLAEKREANDVDPLTWWRVNKQKYGILFPIARYYLVTPPTSVPSERMFSGAGLIYTPIRNRLEGEKEI